MRTRNIGIIGGGPGGLMTAYLLEKWASAPIRITLFEASDKLGGKILTPRFGLRSAQYEAGAAEFYDYSLLEEDPLKELIAELGLPIRAMSGSAVVMNEQVVGNLDDLHRQFGPDAAQSLCDFDRRAKDRMSPQEFYHSDDGDGLRPPSQRGEFASFLQGIGEDSVRDYVETLIHSDLATEPCETNLDYGLQNYLMNDPAYMRLYRIDGGNDQLPRALCQRIHADVRLGHEVTRVSKSGGKLQIESRHRGAEGNGDLRQDNSDCGKFDFVVIALPHDRLNSVEYGGERLRQAMHSHHARFDFPAHYLRMTILFDSPFWRETVTESYFMLDAFGGCCLYDESYRDPESTHGVLGWLLGGHVAQEMSAMSDEELIAAALGSLPPFLAQGRALFLEGRVHRWLGAVNAIPSGLEPIRVDRRHQPEPVEHANLFIVGDYLYDATLNGVLDSAQYVAKWVAAKIADDAATN
jgi:monoamine oxidase